MSETFTGYSSSDELPTDWVKSELLETLQLGWVDTFGEEPPTDWVKSELLETKRLSTKYCSVSAFATPTDWVKA